MVDENEVAEGVGEQAVATAGGEVSGRDEPLYNIGVVERMTGVPIATLRVWERRYGFPTAARTEGGHRIYSEREVARLRWVKARVDDGMQASKAVHALEVAESGGRFPEPPLMATSAASAAVDGEESPALDALRARLTGALLEHDTSTAKRLLGEALPVFSVDEMILGVLRPTMVDIGDGWAEGRVSVSTEHLASSFARERLLQWMATGPDPFPVQPVVLACAPGEWHDLSLLMMGVLLRRKRWPVSYLGQSLPLADLAGFVDVVRPPAVVLSAMGEASAAAIADWPSHMPKAYETGRPPVCFGGIVFEHQPSLVDDVPGKYLGSLDQGLEQLDRLLRDVTGVA